MEAEEPWRICWRASYAAKRKMRPAHRTLQRSLAAYAMGALPADDRATVEHHVAECTSCRGDVARLKKVAARLSEFGRERARVWERVIRSIAASDVRRHSDVVDVVRAAADGDSTACGRLVHRYAPLVWAVARGCGLSPTAAAEVSQTTWLRLADPCSSNWSQRVGRSVAGHGRP